MKIRSDSLYATLGRLGHLDDFFAWYQAECPSYEAMSEWLSERSISTSNGALHNLVTYHLQQWRIARAIDAANAEVLELPADIDDQTRARIKALRLDLAMRDISVDQALTLIRLDQQQDSMRLAREKFEAAEKRLADVRDAIGAARSSGGLTPETLRKIEEAAGLL